ncbi:adhesion G protein-coupled receptor E5-like [Saccostrea echinata]|uniref:adhesion G protein-coupled receptor E5-like n=1 Tax=Saccostrea echinata TaxID=191078 RepID=UPI002A829947|nr:adhesion G protein-coupled receptor E5-like [Saccostrea echinata]
MEFHRSYGKSTLGTAACHDDTGACTCKTGWTGADCSTDIDECANKTDNCNATIETCSNVDGSWSCVCIYGNSSTGCNGGCNDTHYGYQCNQTCPCDLTNTAACHDDTGACTCKTGWTGVDCSTDIDECANKTDNCNATIETCSNVDGSWNCVCIYGNSSTGCNGGCNDTHYGYQCNQTCPCDLTNTAACHDDTGACTCKTGWTGANCSTDIDECATNKHDCNASIETCNNVGGSWNCVCIYGNSSTGCIAKESEYTPESTELKIGVVVTFNETIDLSDYDDAKKEMKIALTNYYKEKIKGFIKVVILVMREGSTVVEHEIVTNKTEKAQQDTALAVVSLSNGENKVEYKNQTLSTTLVTVEDKNITSSNSKCDVYIINFPCDAGEQCIESGDSVYCSKIADDNDEFKLIVGLGVGIPLLFIAVLILAIICVYWRRRQDDDSSNLSEDEFGIAYGSPGSYFPSVIPTKIDSWGRHVSPYSPHYFSDHSTIQGGNRLDDVTNYTEPYLYDNGEKSNFSWDFMFQSLHPNEKFHIRRPEIRSQPLKTE